MKPTESNNALNIAVTGYDSKSIHLIWVLTNYQIAVDRNKKRDRVVPDDILLDTHEGAGKTVWSVLTKILPKGLNGVNYGISLSLWDYIFKTNYIPEESGTIEIGFEGDDKFPKDFIGQNLYGFKKGQQ